MIFFSTNTSLHDDDGDLFNLASAMANDSEMTPVVRWKWAQYHQWPPTTRAEYPSQSHSLLEMWKKARKQGCLFSLLPFDGCIYFQLQPKNNNTVVGEIDLCKDAGRKADGGGPVVLKLDATDYCPWKAPFLLLLLPLFLFVQRRRCSIPSNDRNRNKMVLLLLFFFEIIKGSSWQATTTPNFEFPFLFEICERNFERM